MEYDLAEGVDLAQVILRVHVQPPLPPLAHISHDGFQLESVPQLDCHGVSPACPTQACDWLERS
jgi:hypothetical protein